MLICFFAHVFAQRQDTMVTPGIWGGWVHTHRQGNQVKEKVHGGHHPPTRCQRLAPKRGGKAFPPRGLHMFSQRKVFLSGPSRLPGHSRRPGIGFCLSRSPAFMVYHSHQPPSDPSLCSHHGHLQSYSWVVVMTWKILLRPEVWLG